VRSLTAITLVTIMFLACDIAADIAVRDNDIVRSWDRWSGFMLLCWFFVAGVQLVKEYRDGD
jgi:hypothetical protein